MAAGPQPAIRHRFGPYEADPASGELFKFGVRIRLANKPFQILVALLERPGEVLTREELRTELWSDDTFVDFEHGLNAAINKLRQSLGDEASNPRFIETLPGRGYRFIAPVDTTGLRPVPVVELPRTEPPTKRPLSIPWYWLAAIPAALGAGYWLGVRPVPVKAAAIRFSLPPPSGHYFEPATARQAFELSPDGARIAFSARGRDGNLRIWVRDLSETEPRLVPATTGAYSLAWNSDGTALYTTSSMGLRRHDLAQGTAQVLSAIDPTMMRGVVSLPGQLLVGGNRATALVVPVNGGKPREFRRGLSWPVLLPGREREFLYTGWNDSRDQAEARIGSFDGTSPERVLIESDARTFLVRDRILYVRGGSLSARALSGGESQVLVPKVSYFRPTASVDVSVSGSNLIWLDNPNRSQLVWRNRQGDEIGAVGPEIQSFKWVRLSHDGHTALLGVWEQERGISQIWRAEVTTGTLRQITTDLALKDSPISSPDGSRLVCGRAAGRPPTLHMSALTDGAVVESLPAQSFQLPTDWSADGRFIALTNTPFAASASERNGDVFLVDLARGRELVPLLESPHHESNLVFSPDGRSVAFISTDSGHAELYVQSFDAAARRLTGNRRQISRGGALIARWPRPGQEIFYLGADNWIYSVPWSAGGHAAEPQRLFEISLDTLSVLHSSFSFDVAPGGQKFLLPAYRGDRPLTLQVILNWESLLRNERP